ncbi:MAG: hypothetical protein IJ801_09560 [Lachnospiraceae bacterium]|nr:hypothetical protein [Lachnospiraceae bacterium]
MATIAEKSRTKEIINRLQGIINNASAVPLASGIVTVHKDEVQSLLTELEQQMDIEIKTYHEVNDRKGKIINEAKKEAEKIIYEAEHSASRMRVSKRATNVAPLNYATLNDEERSALGNANEIYGASLIYTDEMLTEVTELVSDVYQNIQSDYRIILEALEEKLGILSHNRQALMQELQEMDEEDRGQQILEIGQLLSNELYNERMKKRMNSDEYDDGSVQLSLDLQEEQVERTRQAEEQARQAEEQVRQAEEHAMWATQALQAVTAERDALREAVEKMKQEEVVQMPYSQSQTPKKPMFVKMIGEDREFTEEEEIDFTDPEEEKTTVGEETGKPDEEEYEIVYVTEDELEEGEEYEIEYVDEDELEEDEEYEIEYVDEDELEEGEEYETVYGNEEDEAAEIAYVDVDEPAEEGQIEIAHADEDAPEEGQIEIAHADEDASEEEETEIAHADEDAFEEGETEIAHADEDASEEEETEIAHGDEDAFEEEETEIAYADEDASEEETTEIVYVDKDEAEENEAAGIAYAEEDKSEKDSVAETMYVDTDQSGEAYELEYIDEGEWEEAVQEENQDEAAAASEAHRYDDEAYEGASPAENIQNEPTLSCEKEEREDGGIGLPVVSNFLQSQKVASAPSEKVAKMARAMTTEKKYSGLIGRAVLERERAEAAVTVEKTDFEVMNEHTSDKEEERKKRESKEEDDDIRIDSEGHKYVQASMKFDENFEIMEF